MAQNEDSGPTPNADPKRDHDRSADDKAKTSDKSAQAGDDSRSGDGNGPGDGTGSNTALPDGVVQGDVDDDALFLKLAEEGMGETIEVIGHRPDRVFDRDTELRISGNTLAERGATNLAEALELLPDVTVRAAGRGGRQIDIRGARKGSVKVLLDGVPISDPYYGNLDISSIPVTDIAQIRVSTTAASPIDGAGGPGGVVEILTRDAIGGRMIVAHLYGSSLPEAQASATGRMMLSEHLALRLSAAGTLGYRDFEIQDGAGMMSDINQDKQQAVGTARLQYKRGKRIATLDVWAQHQSYLVDPREVATSNTTYLFVDGETQGRVGLTFDDHAGKWRLQGSGHLQLLARESTHFADPELTMVNINPQNEDLSANRAGVAAVANRPFGPDMHFVSSISFDTEAAKVCDFTISTDQCDNGFDSSGRASVLSAATGVQWDVRRIRIDGAVGGAVPLGIDADPWPEAKLSVTYFATNSIEIEAVGGHKGRTPTLRERFEVDGGNESLKPEFATYGELQVRAKLGGWVDVRTASFLRRSDNFIRRDTMDSSCGTPLGAGCLVNTDDIDFRGFETRAEIARNRSLSGGGSVAYIEAFNEDQGSDPLDFLPSVTATAWLTAKPHHRFGSTGRVRYVTRQIDGNRELPRRALFELSAFAHIRDDLFGSIRVDNLLDKRYEIRNGVFGIGRVVTLTLQGHWE